MLQRAKSLELRALRAPARIGWVRIRDEDGTFFAPAGPMLLECMEKVNEMATAIAVRGVGYAKAVELGWKFADCDNPSNPELWFKGLRGASRRQVRLAIAEWADGDTRGAYARAAKEFFDWLAARVVPTPQQWRSAQEIARVLGRQAFRHPSRNKRTAALSLRSSCEGSSRPLNCRAIPGDRGATSGQYSRHSSRPT
jgi:hypothetical protein